MARKSEISFFDSDWLRKCLISEGPKSTKTPIDSTLPGCAEEVMSKATTELVSKGIQRDLPDTLDEAKEWIVRLQDSVQREVEKSWNLSDILHENYEKGDVAAKRHKTMVWRLLTQMPREWIRRFIYLDDPHFTTVRRTTLDDNDFDGWDGEY